ncbi:MAG: amidohydrolase, partial [Flavobacteriaceae bacterium]|nr:amidohydrolase [Flavobacteriaceae bacterium]
IHNAKIYTVNDAFDVQEAMVIKDGIIVDIGPQNEILNKYTAKEVVDAGKKPIYPGFIDAHCHFVGYAQNLNEVNLVGTSSFEEVVERVSAFAQTNQSEWIVGRGWDQNDWEVKEFPTKEKLDSVFPDTPVAIRRIDGHALLANQAAIDLAGVTIETPFSGGEIVKKNDKLTGIFIDNPMSLIEAKIPKPSRTEAAAALKEAEAICFSYGLTTVDDAGLSPNTIELIDSLQKNGDLKIRIYAMVSGNLKNINYYLQRGISETDRLHVCSFKLYADGALGSRGAALRKPYSDHPGHYGAMITPLDSLQYYAKRIADSDFQMNTHAIGDSANHFLLKTYEDALSGKKNKRWRIEHAQVISPEDFKYFKDIIPSVQPTHATSDMYWAEDRLGPERIKGAYAYQELLDNYGLVALGTDFPVEQVSPFLTFYAAVARKDLNNYPENGFQPENGLSREETLKGMTIWAAYANFEENEKGSIEPGKMADFIILDRDIMTVPIEEVPNIQVLETYVGGEKVK